MLADETTVGLRQAHHVGEHRTVELDRQATGDVPAVIGGGQEQGVGAGAGADGRGDGGGDGCARKRSAEVAHVVDGGGAVLAEGSGGAGAVAPDDGLDRVGKCAGVTHQLERGGDGGAVYDFGDDPDLGDGHVVFSSTRSQMTLSCSRNSITRR